MPSLRTAQTATALLCCLLLGSASTLSCKEPSVSEPIEKADPTPVSETIELPELPAAKDLGEVFLKHYAPEAEDFAIQMRKVELPIDLSTITNHAKVAPLYLSSPEARDLLSKNGFVVLPAGRLDELQAAYTRVLSQGVPIFVTADTPLHLFHIQFDETLRDIEERVFFEDMLAATRVLLDAAEKEYGSSTGAVKEAARRNAAFFSVALKQLEPGFSPPGHVREVVDWECAKIEEHEGLPEYTLAREKALFRVPEDYSQYKPRGHYTRSEKLQRYFRAMMWYGRMTFLLKGHEEFGPIAPPAKALTDPETARIQTTQAAMIAARAGELALPGGRKLTEVWDRLYAVTAFYAGFADDLSLYDYRHALRAVFGSRFSASELDDAAKHAELVEALAGMRKPAIFSGTGGAGIDPGGKAGHAATGSQNLDEILSSTMGFRLMGQRAIPDSTILGQMVSPAAGTVPRRMAERFTLVTIPDERIQPDLCYSIRGFPMGLDVFSVLGSRRAEQLIADRKEDAYPKYVAQLDRLRREFAAIEARDWNRNLYWSWLYALKTLVAERKEGHQAFQQTEAWLDRQLSSALASWAALRHNTILYAKQSYTPRHIGTTSVRRPPKRPAPPPPPRGLVEPLPLVYARILTTVRMARGGLSELGVLDEAAKARMDSLVSTLERLLAICKRQVANEPISEADNAFLAGLPSALKSAIGEVDERGLKTTLVTDVHTDINTSKCLQEASGYLRLMVVAYARPAGDVVLAVGPVLSHYEFKQPIKNRLTDEQWRVMLVQDKAPPRADWTRSFSAD
ncbi:MAG: DUF3160 domain-containing protein [Deltaproteobacteria bacterium]|nr:DUF3160 domain-containing protein [Deltaproteobacteria bacterium]